MDLPPPPATRLVNLKNTSEFDVYCGRARPGLKCEGADGYFGNPYHVAPHGREIAISMFRSYFERRIKTDPVFRLRVLGLRGKILACYCHPLACHVQVIIDWINAQPIEPAEAP
jgi:hypothetical protein